MPNERQGMDTKKGDQTPPIWWRLAAAVATGIVFTIGVYEVWRIPPLKDQIEKLRASGSSAVAEQQREIPKSLPLSEVEPVSVDFIRHHLEGLDAAGKARRQNGGIVDYRVAAIRTVALTHAATCFKWHLRAGGYTLAADHGFLVSRDESDYLVLKRIPTEELELAYQVPPANESSYLLAPILVLSHTGTIPGPVTKILTSSIESC